MKCIMLTSPKIYDTAGGDDLQTQIDTFLEEHPNIYIKTVNFVPITINGSTHIVIAVIFYKE